MAERERRGAGVRAGDRGIRINGVDIIAFTDGSLITHVKVMVRPLKAINLLHRLMGEQLAKPQAGGPPDPVSGARADIARSEPRLPQFTDCTRSQFR